jgi:hypothetical protein
MDEATWLSCTDPRTHMWALWHLARLGTYRPSERQLLLLACALCRERDDGAPTSPPSGSVVQTARLAIAVAERFADGRAGREELERASGASRRAALQGWSGAQPGGPGGPSPEEREGLLLGPWAGHLSDHLRDPWHLAEDAVKCERARPRRAERERLRRQTGIIRCIFGNPHRALPPRSFPAHVVGLARECYGAFPELSDRFPVLGDALDDLGEAHAAQHCRRGRHVQGCHVLDWIAGQR